MIFRRLSEHISKQSWFAVGLDLIVVVVGIYIIALIRDVPIRIAIGQFEQSCADAVFSASQNLGFMAASAPEVMTWSFMAPKTPGEHKSVTEAEDDSYGYIHQYDIERMLQNPDAANITSWISGWSKYHGAVLVQHHNDTIAFRDLLNEKLSGLR